MIFMNCKKETATVSTNRKPTDNRDTTIALAATRKLRGNSGETIVEALVSLIIAVISIALLVTSITAASKINEKSKARTTEQLSFAYVDSTATNATSGSGASGSATGSGTSAGTATKNDGTVDIDFGTTNSNLTEKNVSVTVYTTENGYKYYRK